MAEAAKPGVFAPSHWSHDGRSLLFRAVAEDNNQPDLWVLPMAGEPKPVPWLKTSLDEYNGQFAPSDRWVAYGSDEAGHLEVYIQSFPTTGAKFLVSVGGGVEPRWSGDGRELFYLSPDSTLMAVSVTELQNGQSLQVGPPTPLFQTHIYRGFSSSARVQYVVTPDGQRFLVNVVSPRTSLITVDVNWTARLKR